MKGEKPSDPIDAINNAKRLLIDHGYTVDKVAGQHVVQIMRMRDVDDLRWKYKVNKVEKRNIPAPGEEIESVTFNPNEIKWRKH